MGLVASGVAVAGGRGDGGEWEVAKYSRIAICSVHGHPVSGAS